MSARFEMAILGSIRRGQERARRGVPPPDAEPGDIEGVRADAERTPEERQKALEAMRRLFGWLLDALEARGIEPEKLAAASTFVELSLAETELAQRYAGPRADELTARAAIAAEFLAVEPHAGRILRLASEMPADTYKPATMQDLLMAAVAERSEGQHHSMKSGARERSAVRRIAEAWRDCTGQKATASFDSRDGTLRQTPFVVFLRYVLNARNLNISDRQIREALHSKTAQKKPHFLAGPHA